MTQDCWVMCGGPSASKFIETKDDIIAVNKDVFRYNLARYFITMDNRFIMWEVDGKHRQLPKRPTSVFIANTANPNLVVGKSICDIRWGISYNLCHYDMIVKSHRMDGGFGFRWNDFRSGGNSGFCAVQFALLMGYKNIHLCGIDLRAMGNATHHHEGYEKNNENYEKSFKNYEKYFVDAVRNYKDLFPHQTLINHSQVSPLKEYLGYEPAN